MHSRQAGGLQQIEGYGSGNVQRRVQSVYQVFIREVIERDRQLLLAEEVDLRLFLRHPDCQKTIHLILLQGGSFLNEMLKPPQGRRGNGFFRQLSLESEKSRAIAPENAVFAEGICQRA